MREFLQWIEDRRTIASFARGIIYILLMWIASRSLPNEENVFGVLIAGAYAADFITWLGIHLLQLSDRIKEFGLKAIPNIIAGFVIYKLLQRNLPTDGVDIAIAFIPFILVLTAKVTYYLLVWNGVLRSDDDGE
jgi:hypothetical protein